MKAIINANIYDYSSYYEDSYIKFEDKITEVGSMKGFSGADEITDVRGALVLPGLINCHTHLYSTFARGMSIPFHPESFMDILQQLWWRLDSVLTGEAIYSSALSAGIEYIKNGVTTIIDHHASKSSRGSLALIKKGICDDLGMRGVFCFETSDRFNVDEAIAENLSFFGSKDGKSTGMFGMHASMTLSEDTMKKISSAVGKLPVHVHVAESIDDQKDCYKKYSKSIVKRFSDYGILNENSILAHCLYISPMESMLIAKNKCFAALNPSSNLNNAVGIADWTTLSALKSSCVLGNDGLGFNIAKEYQNFLFLMKYQTGSPVGFGNDELKKMIENSYTLASKLLGIKLGKISCGYEADMLVLPYFPFTPINHGNIFSHVSNGIFDSFHPTDVIAAGEFLMKNSRLKADEAQINNNSVSIAQKVWDSL